MSFTKVKKGVCAAKGFVANGLNCGLNSDKNKNDLALVYSETQCQAAAVYTTNKVKGAPIQVTKAHLQDIRQRLLLPTAKTPTPAMLTE